MFGPLSTHHVHRFSKSASSKTMKPVHPASHFRTRGLCHPLLAHDEAHEQAVGDAQTAFAFSPLLYGPTFVRRPLLWRVHPYRDTDTIPTTSADGWTIFQWHTGTAMLMFSGYTSHLYCILYARVCGF